jgi:hypothetical protein
MTLSEWRDTRAAEARRIITDPALCAARPFLGQASWCLLKKLSGHPVAPPLRQQRRRAPEVAS